MRYDLTLDFKRMENREGREGLSRPGRGLRGLFHADRGLYPDRPVVKYLASQRNIEIAFAPIAGTRILVPFWMKIPTPLGPARLEATSFITTASPPRVAKRIEGSRSTSSLRKQGPIPPPSMVEAGVRHRRPNDSHAVWGPGSRSQVLACRTTT